MQVTDSSSGGSLNLASVCLPWCHKDFKNKLMMMIIISQDYNLTAFINKQVEPSWSIKIGVNYISVSPSTNIVIKNVNNTSS